MDRRSDSIASRRDDSMMDCEDVQYFEEIVVETRIRTLGDVGAAARSTDIGRSRVSIVAETKRLLSVSISKG